MEGMGAGYFVKSEDKTLKKSVFMPVLVYNYIQISHCVKVKNFM